MTFKWTKQYRSYDLNGFTGHDNGVEGDQHRYSFTKDDGTVVYSDNPINFLLEPHQSFLGWHSADMSRAFPYKKFEDLASAREYFGLVPHRTHSHRITETRFGLIGDDTLKMTITFTSKEEWQRFVEMNHDGIKPITHGMENFRVGLEYDKDYDSSQGHL